MVAVGGWSGEERWPLQRLFCSDGALAVGVLGGTSAVASDGKGTD